jgi:hypothetical protein
LGLASFLQKAHVNGALDGALNQSLNYIGGLTLHLGSLPCYKKGLDNRTSIYRHLKTTLLQNPTNPQVIIIVE